MYGSYTVAHQNKWTEALQIMQIHTLKNVKIAYSCTRTCMVCLIYVIRTAICMRMYPPWVNAKLTGPSCEKSEEVGQNLQKYSELWRIWNYFELQRKSQKRLVEFMIDSHVSRSIQKSCEISPHFPKLSEVGTKYLEISQDFRKPHKIFQSLRIYSEVSQGLPKSHEIFQIIGNPHKKFRSLVRFDELLRHINISWRLTQYHKKRRCFAFILNTGCHLFNFILQHSKNNNNYIWRCLTPDITFNRF